MVSTQTNLYLQTTVFLSRAVSLSLANAWNENKNERFFSLKLNYTHTSKLRFIKKRSVLVCLTKTLSDKLMRIYSLRRTFFCRQNPMATAHMSTIDCIDKASPSKVDVLSSVRVCRIIPMRGMRGKDRNAAQNIN